MKPRDLYGGHDVRLGEPRDSTVLEAENGSVLPNATESGSDCTNICYGKRGAAWRAALLFLILPESALL